MAIEALSSRRTVYGYSDGLKTGDRVRISGTVTDISESGVETIVLDTDQEGYVITAEHGGKR